jgi:hypothetical protein
MKANNRLTILNEILFPDFLNELVPYALMHKTLLEKKLKYPVGQDDESVKRKLGQAILEYR